MGLKRPFFSFRVVTLAQSSPTLDMRFDHQALVLVNECAGWSEVGSLFLRPEKRKGGAGRLLAQSRYMLIGLEPQRFAEMVLAELLDKGCIEAVARLVKSPAAATNAAVVAAPVAADVVSAAPDDEAPAIEGLPPAAGRSAKDNEMARNFMINSINAIIGQNMRVTLVTNIFQAQGSEGLRKVYRDWETSMAGHSAGARRLPELREKLFKIL